MNTDERNLLLRALSERIPYQTAVEPLDGSPAGILKCTDWEGHVWITGRSEPYDVEDVLPLLRKFEDLSRQEVIEIFTKIVGPDITTGPGPDWWFFTDSGEPVCKNEQYSLFFAPDIIDNYLDALRTNWVDTQGLIDRGLAIRVNSMNNPYCLKFSEETLEPETINVATFDSNNWMVLPLKK